MVLRGQSCHPSTVLDAGGKNLKNETIDGECSLNAHVSSYNRVIAHVCYEFYKVDNIYTEFY